MIKLFPSRGEDLLDQASLPPPRPERLAKFGQRILAFIAPPLGTDETELNYRTRPLTPRDELRLTLLLLFGPLSILVLAAGILNGLIWLDPFFRRFALAGILLLGGRFIVRYLI